MGLRIIDDGSCNTIDIDPDCYSSCNGFIQISGSNNYISIGKGSTSYDLHVNIGENCTIKIGENTLLARLKIYTKYKSNINIGNNTGFTNTATLHAAECFDISIGSGCIIADEMLATVSDMHSVIDLDTGQRINHGKSIVIEDSVWLGAAVKVMKGSFIGRGSIIGIGSIVAGVIPKFCLASGSPASIKKTNVTWDYQLL